MINVLHICYGMDESFGGAESFIYNCYSRMNHSLVHFDVFFINQNAFKMKEHSEVLEGSTIKALGINTKRLIGKIHLYFAFLDLIRSEKYDYVHVNTGNIAIQSICALVRRRKEIRIAHSHSAPFHHKDNWFKSIIKKHLRGIIVKNNDYLFACSIDAGKYLFGNTYDVRIVKNAIDSVRFMFNEKNRDAIRDKYGINKNCIVIGHVGRFIDVKNHIFLMHVYSEVLKENKNSKLWLIGQGPLLNEIKRLSVELGLEGKVTFWGQRDDVERLMNAMDVFVLPSITEAFPMVCLEAQASGLPTLISDAITKEVIITDLVKQLSLEKGAKYWADMILNYKCQRRYDRSNIICDCGYDIKANSEAMEKFYVMAKK